MKIYTRRGDAGETDLAHQRVSKAAMRLERLGTLDELQAQLGVVLAHFPACSVVCEMVQTIQINIFEMGASGAGYAPLIPPNQSSLEGWIDTLEAALPPLRHFILPGGTLAAAHLHLARAVCRRLERQLAADMTLPDEAGWAQSILPYINRLSDLLFVMARHANHTVGIADIEWKGQS